MKLINIFICSLTDCCKELAIYLLNSKMSIKPWTSGFKFRKVDNGGVGGFIVVTVETALSVDNISENIATFLKDNKIPYFGFVVFEGKEAKGNAGWFPKQETIQGESADYRSAPLLKKEI